MNNYHFHRVFMWHTAQILWATGSSTLFVPYKTCSLCFKWPFSSRKLTVVSPGSFMWIKKIFIALLIFAGLVRLQVLNVWNVSFLLKECFLYFPLKGRPWADNNNKNVIPRTHYKILLKKNPGIFICLSCWRQPSICNFSWNDNPSLG